MKIAQLVSLQTSVPPINSSGLEFIVYYLTEELVKRGHEVVLFAPGNSKTSAKLEPLILKGVATDPNTTSSPHTYSLWNSFYCFSREKEFDIIHSHLGTTGMFFSHFSKTPLVSTFHHCDRNSKKFYKENEEYYKYTKPIFDYLEQQNCIFVSNSQKKEFSYCFKNSHVVLNGIPIQDFSFSNNPKDYFAYLGFLNYDKGADIAVRVAKKSGIKLTLAGNSTPDFLEKEIKPYLDKKIKYVGPVSKEERNDFLKNAKALLVPIQWNEPFGLVMPEAMACGTPVIGFNKAAVPEIVKHGKTGFIVNNEEEMIEAIGKIDTIDRRKCRKHVEENFTVEKMVDGYEKIYQEVINKHKKISRLCS